MIGYSENDALGELFRQRLENHQMPVDSDGWDEIERRMGKRKNKAVVWLWSAGAAAAAIVALVMIGRPVADETAVMAVSQQITTEETGKTENQSTIEDYTVQLLPSASSQARFNDSTSMRTVESVAILAHNKIDNQIVAELISDSVIQLLSYSDITEKEIPKLDISLVEDWPEEDGTFTKKTEKWLLAAAFGASGYTNGYANDPSDGPASSGTSFQKMGLSGSGNEYAADMVSSVPSFNHMPKNAFADISHRPPLSIGVTARKSLGKSVGIESGLVYTCLMSHFKWPDHDARQSLHYVGVPVNMAVYLWKSNPNWRMYLSGGFTVEKGLRAVYRQERQMLSEHRITTVKSSIDGWQWSLNSAWGIIYRLEKGFGIYFEPRVGYSFDCNQPVSIRTEWPVYFGVNLGLNYEL